MQGEIVADFYMQLQTLHTITLHAITDIAADSGIGEI